MKKAIRINGNTYLVSDNKANILLAIVIIGIVAVVFMASKAI